MRTRVYAWRCKSRRCTFQYTGETDAIYFKSSSIAVCDEIMHDFEYRFLDCNIRYNFSAYVDEMNFSYQSQGATCNTFMSKSSFVDTFFCWLSAKGIDFRNHIDPFCGHNPDMLACDGTHIGPALRNLSMTPIETADESKGNVIVESKRYGRTFIPGVDINSKDAREYLTDLANNVDHASSKERLDNLIGLCPTVFEPILRSFDSSILSESFSTATSNLLRFLSSDAALITLIPYDSVDDITDMLTPQELVNQECIQRLKPTLGSPISEFLMESLDTEHKLSAVECIIALASEVKKFYGSASIIPANEIDSTYRPHSGVAYYFTPSGNKIRTLPNYTLNESASETQRTMVHTECSKKFPRVSRGGYSNLFLWLCPKHGHCYGFHLIPGSEGRKDPFASIYQYKPVPPKHVFYDFSCSLSEYSLSRAPGYFRHVRMWFDLFHSFNHTCGDAFKYQRLDSSIGNPNTEICEQFNAYLQRIKYCATHLSQAKFCFLLQYAIYKWNIKRTEVCKKRQLMLIKCCQ